MPEMNKSGYPSIDRPWMKYYPKEYWDAEPPHCSLYDFLWMNNKDFPDDIALNFCDKEFTYGWLFRQIDAMAEALVGNGVKPGDVVTIVTLSCPMSVILLYAINRVGAIANFSNVLLDEKHTRFSIIDGDSKLVFTEDTFAENVLRAAEYTLAEQVVVYPITEGVLTPACSELPTENADCPKQKDGKRTDVASFMKNRKPVLPNLKNPNETAFYGHTGGSTNISKTVLLSDNAINAIVWQYLLFASTKRGETLLSVLPMFITYGLVTNIHIPLCGGLKAVLIPKVDNNRWAEYLQKYHPIHIYSIPPYVLALLDAAARKNIDISAMKTLVTGGESFNVAQREWIDAFFQEHGYAVRVLQGYGMTECGGPAAVEFLHTQRIGSVGIPYLKNNFMIYDNENQRELPYNQSGEICIQPTSVMLDYSFLDSDELIRTHSDGSRWIHTADIGHIDEDGFVFIEGRMKRIIIIYISGIAYKVFPSRVENILNKSKSVSESCVVAMQNGDRRLLKAYLTLKSELDESAKLRLYEELRKMCEQTLSPYEIPCAFEALSEFPRTAVGKIDYRTLEKEAML